MAGPQEVLTLDEGAARLTIAKKTLRDWVRAGKFPGFKVGHEWRVLASDVEHYLEERIERRPRPVPVGETPDT